MAETPAKKLLQKQAEGVNRLIMFSLLSLLWNWGKAESTDWNQAAGETSTEARARYDLTHTEVFKVVRRNGKTGVRGNGNRRWRNRIHKSRREARWGAVSLSIANSAPLTRLMNASCPVAPLFQKAGNIFISSEMVSTAKGWIVSPEKRCWSSNPQHLRLWHYLEIGLLRILEDSVHK